jgi:hypothetical protein
MSSGLIILVATATAAAVIVLALTLSKLLRTLVDNASDFVPDLSRLPRAFSRRPSPARLGIRPMGVGPVGSAHAGEKPVAPRVPSEGSIDVKQYEPEQRREEDEEGGGPGYRQVGEEVTAVLTAAEHAATQIRETALREAEQSRLDAAEKASATLAEAQACRAEADSYSEETRAAADARAEATRREADEKAARTISHAEEQARVIQAEAEQKRADIEGEAIQRRDALTRSTEGMEDRIESMLMAFRGVTVELEELLPIERRSGADEPEPPGDERLDEALMPAPSHRRLRSDADW